MLCLFYYVQPGKRKRTEAEEDDYMDELFEMIGQNEIDQFSFLQIQIVTVISSNGIFSQLGQFLLPS